MTLPHDFTDDDGHRFYQTLNEDILLLPDEYNRWDVQFHDGDLVNVTGHDSLKNAICIAIMTRFRELRRKDRERLYDDFGCRIHELIKDNKNDMTKFKIEAYIREVLQNMRRVYGINYIEIVDSPDHVYRVYFSVQSLSDELVEGSVDL